MNFSPHSTLEHRDSKHTLGSPQSILGIGILKENYNTSLPQIDRVAEWLKTVGLVDQKTH